MEFDEKQLRKEIMFAIKNIHGIRYMFIVFKTLYYSTIAPFYHVRAKECAKYAATLFNTVEQGKNTD